MSSLLFKPLQGHPMCAYFCAKIEDSPQQYTQNRQSTKFYRQTHASLSTSATNLFCTPFFSKLNTLTKITDKTGKNLQGV
jgi:hypothetical protein